MRGDLPVKFRKHRIRCLSGCGTVSHFATLGGYLNCKTLSRQKPASLQYSGSGPLVSPSNNRYEPDRAEERRPDPRRGGRVVECTALEMRHGCKPIGGSNPPLSAISFCAPRRTYCAHIPFNFPARN